MCSIADSGQPRKSDIAGALQMVGSQRRLAICKVSSNSRAAPSAGGEGSICKICKKLSASPYVVRSRQ